MSAPPTVAPLGTAALDPADPASFGGYPIHEAWETERWNELRRGYHQAGQMVDLLGPPPLKVDPRRMKELETAMVAWQEEAEAAALDAFPRGAEAVAPGERYEENPHRVAFDMARRAARENAQERAMREAMVADPQAQARSIARHERALQAIPTSRAMREYQEAGGVGETIGAVLANPIAVPADLALGSLPSMVPAMAMGAAGGMRFGPLGTAAGTFLGSLAPEYAGKFLEVMQSDGVDLTNETSIEGFLSNPDRMDRARNVALRKGIPVALVDALSAKLGGRFLGKAMGTGAGKVALATLKEGATQAALGGAGEALGEVVAGDKLSPQDIIAEMVAEVPGSVHEVATNLRHERRHGPIIAFEKELERMGNAADALPPQEPAPAPAAQPPKPSAAETGDNMGPAASPAGAAGSEQGIDQVLASVMEADRAQRAARAQAEAERTQRQADAAARREAVEKHLEHAAATVAAESPAWADVAGTLNTLGAYQADNSLGLDQPQRERVAKLLRELAPLRDRLWPAEEARRAEAARQAEADAQAARERARTERKALQEQDRTGRDPQSGLIADLARVPSAELESFNWKRDRFDAAGEEFTPERIEAELTRRMRAEERAGAEDAQGPDLLTVLRGRLPAQDTGSLNTELRQVIDEHMNPAQRMKLVRSGAGSLDDLVTALRADDGFTQLRTPADLIEAVQRALAGQTVRPEHRVEFARALPPGTRISRQAPFEFRGRQVPGFTSIDFPENSRSADPATLRGEGFDVPDAEAFPTGKWEVGARGELAAVEYAAAQRAKPVTRGIRGETLVQPVPVVQAGRATLHHIDIPAQNRPSGISLGETAEGDSTGRIKRGDAITVGELLEGVKPEEGGAYSAEFATAGTAPTAGGLTEAQRDRIWRRIRDGFGSLADEVDIEIALNRNQMAEWYRAEIGKPLRMRRIEAVVIPARFRQGLAAATAKRDAIVFAHLAWQSNGKGVARLLHEVGHSYWAFLPDGTREVLREEHRRQVESAHALRAAALGRTNPTPEEMAALRSQRGPLFGENGENLTGMEGVGSLDEHGAREWFAEMIAWRNRQWALDRFEAAGTLRGKARLAFESAWRAVLDLLERVVHGAIREKGQNPRADFWEGKFRDFLLHGAKWAEAQETGAVAYATAEGQPSDGLRVNNPEDLMALARSSDNRKRFWSLPLRTESLGALGARFDGFRRMFDVFALRHVLRRHGEGSEDPNPITKADIINLPRIVDAPGATAFAGRSATGRETILSVRPHGDFFYVLEEVRDANRVLAIHTLWKTKAPSLESDVAPAQTSEAIQSMAQRKLTEVIAEFKRRNPERFGALDKLKPASYATDSTVPVEPDPTSAAPAGFEENIGNLPDENKPGIEFARAERPIPPVAEAKAQMDAARDTLDATLERATRLETQLEELRESQEPDVEERGRALRAEIQAAWKEQAEAYRKFEAARTQHDIAEAKDRKAKRQDAPQTAPAVIPPSSNAQTIAEKGMGSPPDRLTILRNDVAALTRRIEETDRDGNTRANTLLRKLHRETLAKLRALEKGEAVPAPQDKSQRQPNTSNPPAPAVLTPPAKETAEVAQPDDAEPSPFNAAQTESTVNSGKAAELEGQSYVTPSWFMRTREGFLKLLAGFRGSIPELPTFPRAWWNKADTFLAGNPEFYNRAKEGAAALRRALPHVLKTAEEQIAAVRRPLIAARKGVFDADGYNRLQKLQARRNSLKADKRPIPYAMDAEIEALRTQFEQDPYVLFSRLVLYLDLQWRAQNLKNERGEAITLPMNLNLDEVEQRLAQVQEAIRANGFDAAIGTALRTHVTLVRGIADDLAQRDLLPQDTLRNPYYFPHLVLTTSRGGKERARVFTLERVGADTAEDFRGYLIDPVGSDRPIETDYIKAMYYHLVQVGAHNARSDVIRDFFLPYNIRDEVAARAKELTIRRDHPVSWRQAFDEEFAARGYALFTADDARTLIPSLTIDRDKLARRLGVMIGEGSLRAELEKLGVKGIKLLPEDIREAMMAGEKEVWILPARVADALKGISARDQRVDNSIEKVLRGGVGAWKVNMLFAPWNYIRYEFNNMVSDGEKLFSADPAAAKYLKRAAREVWAFQRGIGEGTPEVREASRLGVLQSLTAEEMDALPDLRAFEDMATDRRKLWNYIRRNNTMAFSKFREGWWRYAKYLADLERIRAGARPVYAGAYWRDIEAMGDTRPGAGDAAARKAAEISIRTFGDYGDISVNGGWLRQKLIPFYSWIEVNFKYHANLFRNLRDAIAAGDAAAAAVAKTDARRAAAVFAFTLTRKAAGMFLLRLALPYVAVMAWNNSGDNGDIEDELSEEDRRRFHIIVGRDENGKALVIYAPTALADVMKWFSGPEAARLAIEIAKGQTDLPTALGEWTDRIVPDFINNTVGSFGPLAKVPVMAATHMDFFPDVTEPRKIPAYDFRRALIAAGTDQTLADWFERVVNKDYLAPKDFGEWAQQAFLQVRRRDAESWAYFAIRDRVNDFVEQRTGKTRDSSFDAPDQQVLRNFRRSIYRGDIPNALRFYDRLLEYGYTAERLQASVRAQHPLSGLPVALRRDFVESLPPFQRAQLDRALRYYTRISTLKGDERQLFPREGKTPAQGEAIRRTFRPRPDVLQSEIDSREQMSDEEIARRARENLLQVLQR